MRLSAPPGVGRDDRGVGAGERLRRGDWTAPPSNFAEFGEPFSTTAALAYLEKLEARDAARFEFALAYIRNAPPEVDTPVREEVARRWPA